MLAAFSIAGDGVRLYTIISPDGPSGSQNGNNVRIHKRILESKDYNGVVITHEFLHVIGMKHKQEGTNWEGGALEVLANIAGDVNTTPHFDKRPETKAFNEQDRAILRDNLYTLHFSLMRVNFNSVDSYHHRYYQYKE